MLKWLKSLFAGNAGESAPGMVTRTCKMCGKTFTLPEEVQHWPDCCQACRAKYRPEEPITRTCRGCGRRFTFSSSERRWPKLCPDCRAGREGRRDDS